MSNAALRPAFASAPVIVGGGPAGAAAAIALLRAGVRPLLVERQSGPGDALCGGFLSWRTLEQLDALGLSKADLGGHDITALRLFCAGESRIVALPGPAMALSRRRLDALLLARALAAGVTVRHDHAVYRDGMLHLGAGERLACESLFVATGKHDLHGLARPRDATARDPFLGLRLRLPSSRTLAGLLADRIEIHLFHGGYLGVVLQEDGSANFCMAVRKSRLARADGRPAALFAQLAGESPFLADRLAAIPACPGIDAIGFVPYGWRARAGREGIFRLGDQAGVIPSLAGEGIGVALASAQSAVHHWLQGGAASAPAFQQAFARRLRRPLATAGLIAALGTHSSVALLPLASVIGMPGLAGLIARWTRV